MVPDKVSDVAASAVNFLTNGAASDIACNGLTWQNALNGAAAIGLNFVPGGDLARVGERFAAKAGALARRFVTETTATSRR